MKKGDKVRFLSEVGGGKVAGFQGKNIVLVEDEDGFEIPMPINEVVVVDQDDVLYLNSLKDGVFEIVMTSDAYDTDLEAIVKK